MYINTHICIYIYSRAFCLLCGCYCPVRGRVCFLVIGAEAPRSVSELCFWSEVQGMWVAALSLGEEPLHCISSRVSMLCCVTFSWLCWFTEYTVVGTSLSPTLTVGMSVIGLGVSQAFFFFTRPSVQINWDHYKERSIHTPGTAVGSMEAAQSLVWSNTHVYMPTKSTFAKARPV